MITIKNKKKTLEGTVEEIRKFSLYQERNNNLKKKGKQILRMDNYQ